MSATVSGIHLGPDTHANRPAANAAGQPFGALYSCTTHGLIYKTDGSSWSTYATLGGSPSGSITASGYTQSTAKLLGRTTASTGAIEEISVGSGLTFSGGSLSASGGGGGTPAYLGYNTVGGSTQAMTQKRIYCKQITVGGSDVVLHSIEAYVAITAEAIVNFGFALFADSGSDTIGDILSHEVGGLSGTGMSLILAHATGNYPARWYGQAFGRLLTASTKYWIGIYWFDGASAPNLYYDGSGSDRYYAAGATPYIGDGQYSTFSQTNTTNKHSIRALVV